jgi:hypothetical protein
MSGAFTRQEPREQEQHDHERDQERQQIEEQARHNRMCRPPVLCHSRSEVPMSRRALLRRLIASCVVGSTLWLAACDEKSPSSPSASAVVTFRVGPETFRIRVVGPEPIAAAEAARAGGSASIPAGRLVAGAQVNTGWSWHLEDVSFVEVAIELCDGLPSHVEAAGVSYANGRYCPWGARVTDIRGE